MITRLLGGLVICSFVAGVLSLGSTSAAASQMITSTAVSQSALPRRQLESPVEREMLALERHAKVNMILYSGSLGQAASGSTPVVALSVTVRAR